MKSFKKRSVTGGTAGRIMRAVALVTVLAMFLSGLPEGGLSFARGNAGVKVSAADGERRVMTLVYYDASQIELLSGHGLYADFGVGPDIRSLVFSDVNSESSIDKVGVADDFGFRAILSKMDKEAATYRVFLVPFDTPHTLDGFENCRTRTLLEKAKSMSYGTYYNGSTATDMNELEIPDVRFSWNSWKVSSDVYPYEGSPYEYALASGVYSPVVAYFYDDLVSADIAGGELMFTDKVIRIDNPEDGGYVSDEYYGYEDLTEYIGLDVNVTAGSRELTSNEVEITAFDAFGTKGECFGKTPCKVPAGSKVKLKIEPINTAYDLRYQYSFPIVDDMLYEYEVPLDGKLDIYIDNPDMNTTVSGIITAPVNTGGGKTEVKGVGGIAVTVSQYFNGTSESFVVYTGSNGEYEARVFENIPATVIIEDKYYERFTSELPAAKMTRGTVNVDAQLKARTIEIAECNTGAVKIPITCAAGETVQAYAVLFDMDGNKVASDSVFVNRTSDNSATDMITFEADEGEYTLAVFDNSGSTGNYICVIDDLDLMLKNAEVVRISLSADNGCDIKSGLVTTLDTVTVPKAENLRYEGTPISTNSYITVPADYTAKGEHISVSGHIECGSGNAVVSAVYVVAESMQSTGSFQQAGGTYVKDSLVMNGRAAQAEASASTHIETRLVPKAKSAGDTDFSFKIEASSTNDIRLKVCADVVVDGQSYEYLEVGTAIIKGRPISISAPDTTATGNILVTGASNFEGKVSVYDNGSFVGEALVDRYGTWEMYLRLPCSDIKTMHSLVAKCNGNESEPVNVLCDASATVLRGVYMVEDGSMLPNTYIWTSHSKLGFLAVYENGENVSDVAVLVLCSDGTMLELPAEKLSESKAETYLGSPDNGTVCFVTESYPFGEKNLVPSKAWAVSGATEDGPVDAPKEKYTGVISASMYRGVDTEKVAAEWSRNKKIVTEFPGPDTIAEGESGLGFLYYETETAELEALADKGAHCTKIVDDYGNLMYEGYFFAGDGMLIYGYTDYNSTENYGKSFIVAGSLVDSSGFASGINSIYDTLAKADSKFRYVDNSYPRTIGGQCAFIQQAGAQYSSTTVKWAGPSTVDYLSDVVNGALTEEGRAQMKKLPIGDLLTIDSIRESAQALCKARETTAPARDELNFYKLLMIQMSEKDAVDKKSYKRINNYLNNAINSMDTAEGLYKDQFLANLESAGLCKLTELGGPAVKGVGVVGGMVSDLMCSDMGTNAEVVLSGAQGDYLEAKLYMMKAFGISKDQLNELYRDYQEGLTLYSLRKKLREEIKEDEQGTEYTIIIDPSGYVYEAVASNRIEGATVTLYGEGMEMFDAARYGQANPLTSDADGRYAWDVPEGNWFVKAFKAGYEVGTSQNDPAATVTVDGVNYLPVMPPQLDVNIPLTAEGRAHASVYFKDGKWYLEFDKYVQLDTVNSATIQFINAAYLETYVQAVDPVTGEVTDTGYPVVQGDAVACVAVLTPLDAELSPAHTPVCGGKMLARTFELMFTNGQAEDEALTVEIGEGLLTYNGKPAKCVVNVNKAETSDTGTGTGGTTGGSTSGGNKIGNNIKNGNFEDDEENVEGEVTHRAGFPGWAIALIVVAVLGGGGVAAWFFLRKKKGS